MAKKLKIGISMGDPAGVGPELIIRGLKEQRMREIFTPVIYGSPRVLNIYRKVLDVEKFSYNVVEFANQAHQVKINVIDCGVEIDKVDIGVASEDCGKAAFQFLERAVSDLKEGHIDALVTLPIDKATAKAGGLDFPGHTWYIANAIGMQDALMLMAWENIRISPVTDHIPLKEVSAALTPQKIHEKLKLMAHCLKTDFNLPKPKIAVLGLNPHAGDSGLLGTEEQEVIAEGLRLAEKDKILAVGPFPADGFFGAGTFTQFDGILAMYHDQGLIPFKLLAGFLGVNFTAGLPVIRTSPDHGVAYGLAGKNEVDVNSFLNAIFLAMDVYATRNENEELQDGALEFSKKPGRQGKEKYSKEKVVPQQEKQN